tara:strand:+ start:3883 stop:4695 length:813 start_codon:yes stop_codon:yes gene_type:complete
VTPIFSIVMAYHNRKPLLLHTLRSIAASTQAKYTEVIIVDDGSSDDHRLEDIVDDYPFVIKLIRQETEDKWYINPCIPFNLGIKEATGDIIVIQNPECFHLGDVLKFATAIDDDTYYSYHAYSLSKEKTEKMDCIDPKMINELGNKVTTSSLPFGLENKTMNMEGGDGYYNHYQYRPTGYHFCAITKRRNMEDLGGFDERYATGSGFDDNELVERVKRKGLKLLLVSYPMVLHQNHYEGWKRPDPSLIHQNLKLFNEVTLQETTWRVNQK